MRETDNSRFPLVDEYVGIRLGRRLSTLEPGTTAVVETERRLRREEGYGYVRVLWWLRLDDGRSVVSVPPGAGPAVREIVSPVRSEGEMFAQEVASELRPVIDETLARAGLRATDRVLHSSCFACNPSLLRLHAHGDCRRLTDASVPAAERMKLPGHCFPDGIVYAVVEDGLAVSIAFAHRTGVMEDRIADPGIETAPPYRRRGYAKTALSHVVAHVTRSGGEARYGCSPENAASIATARSVGFVPYGRTLILSAPAPDL